MDKSESKLITKQAIVHSLANAIMRLGKGDWEGVLWNIDKAREQFVTWRDQRREAKLLEKVFGDEIDQQHANALNELEHESRRTTRPSGHS